MKVLLNFRTLQCATFFLINVIFMSQAFAETVPEFAKRCETQLSIPVAIPSFNCATALALQNSMFGQACDAQARLGGPGCTDGQKMGKLNLGNPDVAGVFICRKYAGQALAADEYTDVALIIHNKNNGKTCFFQSHLSGSKHQAQVPSPRDSNASLVWSAVEADDPQSKCVRCHSNDSFNVSPHVVTAFDKLHLVGFDPLGQYSYLKMGVASAINVALPAQGCSAGCHRVASETAGNSVAAGQGWMTPKSNWLWDTFSHRIKTTPADLAAFRPSEGKWYVWDRVNGKNSYYSWGASGDIPIDADYDGDGQNDIAVYRPGESRYYIIYSSTGASQSVNFGQAGDKPIPADYNDDGRADIAVWRPSNGTWYIVDWASWTYYGTQWGLSGDIPVPADFDGDHKADLTVYRPSNYTWYRINSATGQGVQQAWGGSGDIPTPGDFTGDGKADIAIWRPSTGTWWVIRSEDGAGFTQQWGLSGDRVVAGDYDGDGKLDFGVWRPSNETWYFIYSSTGQGWWATWGVKTDILKPTYRTHIQ